MLESDIVRESENLCWGVVGCGGVGCGGVGRVWVCVEATKAAKSATSKP